MQKIPNYLGEQLPISEFAEKAYLNYAMYVILDRALPSVADGLKPVQRRIVYAMSELGLKNTAKYKKSARTVGDVLGKFHPHGDSACYEAMVLMAQNFSYRYPLIDGQGNWGAPDDPKSFAAMRYTESRLSAYSDLLLSELGQGTSEWVPNFDGTLNEPKLLPARIPNILLNGGSGIAVGMATDIPPHNLNELLSVCDLLLTKPETDFEQIYKLLPAPDLPTGSKIVSSTEELKAIYQKGIGQYRAQATYHLEKQAIIITELPYQASVSKILTQIAKQIRDKKMPWLEDIRDESDHQHPTRLVLILRSKKIDAEALMEHLFATTDLEKSYRVNMNVIGLNGKPQVKNIKQIISEWLSFRQQTVRNRLNHRRDQVVDRLHVLEGLLIAYLNLDEIIHIIRTHDKPKQELIQRFEITERQAEAILETKLRQLAKLEQLKIEKEQKSLAKELSELEAILSSETKLNNLIRQELKQIGKQHGDPRRTVISHKQRPQPLSQEQLSPAEVVTVILSKQGWIRAAKGEIDTDSLNFRGSDQLNLVATGKNNYALILMDQSGKTYTLNPRELASVRGHGDPITSLLNLSSNTKIIDMLLTTNESHFLIVADDGYGYQVPYIALQSKTKNGKNIVNLTENAKLFPLQPIQDEEYLVVISSTGYLLCFPIEQIPLLNRGKGNKFMAIKSQQGETLAHCCLVKTEKGLTLYNGRNKMRLTWDDLQRIQSNRGKRGTRLPSGFNKITRIRQH